MAKLTAEQFFAAIAPEVLRVREEGSPLFPSVRLAQCLLETGGVIPAWNNLGGIKTGSGKPNAYWHGEAVVKGTWEYVDGRSVGTRATFRAYKSLYHFFKDMDLLLGTMRYERVRLAQTPEEQARMLQACGYATDPAYASKLIAIMKRYGLKRYDEAKPAAAKPKPFEKAVRVSVRHRDAEIGAGYLLDGTTWVPARTIGEALGGRIGWKSGKVTVNGKETETLLDGSTGYVKVRSLAGELGLPIEWDGKAQAVRIGSVKA
jgi:Muramidase (flagellum-specific)